MFLERDNESEEDSDSVSFGVAVFGKVSDCSEVLEREAENVFVCVSLLLRVAVLVREEENVLVCVSLSLRVAVME